MVVTVIKQQATSGHVFAFCNRTGNRVKCLHWDGSGQPERGWIAMSGFFAT
jgi:transposase